MRNRLLIGHSSQAGRCIGTSHGAEYGGADQFTGLTYSAKVHFLVVCYITNAVNDTCRPGQWGVYFFRCHCEKLLRTFSKGFKIAPNLVPLVNMYIVCHRDKTYLKRELSLGPFWPKKWQLQQARLFTRWLEFVFIFIPTYLPTYLQDGLNLFLFYTSSLVCCN